MIDQNKMTNDEIMKELDNSKISLGDAKDMLAGFIRIQKSINPTIHLLKNILDTEIIDKLVKANNEAVDNIEFLVKLIATETDIAEFESGKLTKGN